MDSQRRARLLLAAVVAYNVALFVAYANAVVPLWPGGGSGVEGDRSATAMHCSGPAAPGPFGSAPAPDPFCAGRPGAVLLSEDFEGKGTCQPDGWHPYEYHSGAYCVVGEASRSGLHSMFVSDYSTVRSAGAASECVPVSPGQVVTATAWYRGNSPPDPNAHFNLYVEFFDTWTPAGSGTRLGVVWDGAPASDPTWRPFSVSGAAPPGTVCAWVLLYSSVGSAGVYYVDDVTLQAAEGRPLWG